MLRLFSTTAMQAAAVPFTRMYKGFKVVWNDRVHRSAAGDAISDMAIDKNLAELTADGIAEIQQRAPLHPGDEDNDHLTSYGLDSFGRRIWTYHFYPGGVMKKWKYAGKQGKESKEASKGDGSKSPSPGKSS